MKVFEPKIEIRLIKSSRREELSQGVATAKRYRTLSSLDLTPYLADGTLVQLGKSVREPVGAWSFSLVDRMVLGANESLYALIEPMDMVEFRLAHNPADPAYAGASGGSRYQLPVVMRGFVSSVSRSRSMDDGHPSRMIQVSGHDFGKILQILRIYYLNNSVIGDNIVAELKFFQKYASSADAKIMTAAEFVQLVLDKIINPYIGKLTLNADGQGAEASVVSKLTADVSTPGAVDPHAIAAFVDGSVYEFLTTFLDVGAFNELYLEESEVGVALVVRPNPFLDANRRPIQAPLTQSKKDDQAALKVKVDAAQASYEEANAKADLSLSAAKSALASAEAAEAGGDADMAAQYRAISQARLDDYKHEAAVAKPLLDNWLALNKQYKANATAVPDALPTQVVEIDVADVESITEARSDSGVANYYWVTNTGWQLIMNEGMRQLAAASPVTDYAPFDYVNCAAARYGFRKMEVSSSMGPDTLLNRGARPAADTLTENDKLLGWLVERRRILAAQNRDNVVFESGSMRVRGNERIKAGVSLAVRQGSARTLYYVTHVAHEYLPFNSFKTTVMFERGTGFIDRAQAAVAPYLAELNGKGAV
ncbi:hypothetical protein AB4Z27_26035 [Cupriavidus sp. KB_39]|uniref:hypothetical protein n=1 Tax=Cupriavidus sp. KB_39 TaxID=3233036 RepID=UPI003F934CC6